MIIALFAAIYRGAAFDEFATLFFSDPAIPLGKALHEVWPQETIPFVYYAACRFLRDAFGDDVMGLRWSNFPPMLAVLAWFASVWRGSPQRRMFLALFAILSFCGKTTFTYFPYFRDYYWQWAAETIFVGAAATDRLDGRANVNPWLIAATPFVFCLHQVTAVYAAALSGLLLIDEARQRHFARFFALAAAAIVGLMPLGYFLWLQYQLAGSAYHQVDWIPSLGPAKALGAIIGGIAEALGQNWIAPALLLFFWRKLPRRDRIDRQTLLMLAIAFATPTLGAIIVDSFKPIISQRYFGMASVEVAALLALALAPLATQRGGALMLVALNGIVFALSFGVLEAIKQNYDDGAAIIERIVRACPTTTVHSGDRKLDYRDALAFDYLSRRHHFVIEPPTPEIPTACPALYWAEGMRVRGNKVAEFGGLSRATNAFVGLGLSEAQLQAAKTLRSSQGEIVVVGGADFARSPLLKDAVP